jgi:hypothetical protein
LALHLRCSKSKSRTSERCIGDAQVARGSSGYCRLAFSDEQTKTSLFQVSGLKSLALLIGIKQKLKKEISSTNASRRIKCDFLKDAPEE